MVVPLQGYMPRQLPPHAERWSRPVRPKRRAPWTRITRPVQPQRLDIQQYLELEFSVDERR
jgi:hypothetical protein